MLGILSKTAEILFVCVLLAGVPLLSHLTTRDLQVRSLPRAAVYFSAVVSQFMLAALATSIMLATSRSFRATGFRGVPFSSLARWTTLITVVSLVALGIVLLLQRQGRWPPESDLVCWLMPETRTEKLYAALIVAPTAAFCEEYVYRGYLLAVLGRWCGAVRWGWLLSSLAFGLAHAYQGASGMVRAGLLGALLAYPVLSSGSLYPSMAAHFFIDAVALAWLGPSLLRRGAKR